MPNLPTLGQLGYLVERSERLNFRVAADAQFVTQSTLSAGIEELETLLGVQLVERNHRSVRLTVVGEDVVARARELLAAATDLAEAARSAIRPLSGPLRLGAIPTVLIALLFDTGDLYVRELFKDACHPRRGTSESPVEATSLTTLIRMVEGRARGDAAARDHARRGHPQGHPARRSPVLAAGAVADAGPGDAARRTSSRRSDADLVAAFLLEQHRRPRAAASPRCAVIAEGMRREACSSSHDRRRHELQLGLRDRECAAARASAPMRRVRARCRHFH